jgi:energy-coupling factor transport system ATP-binding protein
VIAMRPRVLFLDEPTAGLDPAGFAEILGDVLEYREREGASVVIVSHSMEEVARAAGRIVVMDGGQMAMEGTPAEVFSQPEELERLGLDVPQVTKLAGLLRGKGLRLDGTIYTLDQAETAVLGLLSGAGESPC